LCPETELGEDRGLFDCVLNPGKVPQAYRNVIQVG